jgi:hypothetical protein
MRNAMSAAPAALLACSLLTGCAGLNSLTSDVSSFSQWPAGRQPGTYAFERLPSQQARPEQQQQLENAARTALQTAGFRAAPDEKSAEFNVQLGARVSLDERSLYQDPFWWQHGLHTGPLGRGLYWGQGFAFRFDHASYEREVALLIRDRKSGQALYEARASNDGASASIGHLLPAMFEAALKDFPYGGVNPRRVTIPMAP